MDSFPESSTTSRRKKPKRPCGVCGETSSGAHFGAEACRACAAFFRRSAAQNKKYKCRLGGKCTIAPNIRNMCRACRFEKCIQAGMRKTAVQRYLDGIEQQIGEIEDGNEPPSPVFSKELGMPTLAIMINNYKGIEKVRRLIHNRRNTSALNKADAKPVDFLECGKIHLKEIGLIMDFLVKSFPELQEISQDQKKNMYRLFYRKFIIFEAAYFASLKRRNDILILPTGDFIDISRPGLFFHEINGNSTMSKDEALQLFAPMFDNYRRSLLEPMNQHRLDETEFLALCALTFWDLGLEGQSSECESLATQIRGRILDEIIFYHRNVKRIKDPAVRISNIMILLPPLQRVVQRLQEDIEMSHAFDVFKVSDAFYGVVNCAF